MGKFLTMFLSSVVVAAIAIVGFLLLVPFSEVSGKSTEGGTLILGAVPPAAGTVDLVDHKSGVTYSLRLLADDTEFFMGRVTMQLDGPPPSGRPMKLCSAHGGPAIIDFSAAPVGGDPFEHRYIGTRPLTFVECGAVRHMAVAINGCIANLQFHGYMHSDAPNVTYSGSVTVDVRFKKDKGQAAGVMSVDVSTPRETLKLEGRVTGPMAMETCP